jgi:hypothetical protein
VRKVQRLELEAKDFYRSKLINSLLINNDKNAGLPNTYLEEDIVQASFKRLDNSQSQVIVNPSSVVRGRRT